MSLPVKDMLVLLRQWPAPSTLFVMLTLVAWALWANSPYGYALDEDVNELREDMEFLVQEIKEGNMVTLEGQLFDLKVAQCKATGDLRRVYAERVSSLQARYRELVGQYYRLPECNEL